jgi:hypothetical protein
MISNFFVIGLAKPSSSSSYHSCGLNEMNINQGTSNVVTSQI